MDILKAKLDMNGGAPDIYTIFTRATWKNVPIIISTILFDYLTDTDLPIVLIIIN